MRKMFVVIFLFSSISVFSQTWTETSGFGGRHTEWMVITRDEWNRLRVQREEDKYFVEIIYTDAFEMRTGGVNRVLSGTRPNFNGYYYLYGKWFGFLGGWELVLAYGNSNTGRMEIRYPQYATEWTNFRAGSNQYWNLYNRYIRRVNEETISFPSGFVGTWKRNNFNNMLTFTSNTVKASNQSGAWNLTNISGDLYTLSIQTRSDNPTITIRMEGNNLVISRDIGTDENNWNGVWLRQ